MTEPDPFESGPFEARLTTMLHRVADTARIDDLPFDATGRSAMAPVARPGRSPALRPSHRLAVAAIALLVVAIVAAIAVATTDDHRPSITTEPGSEPSVLVPGTIPAGMTLWSVDVATPGDDGATDLISWPPKSGPLTSQRFAATDGTADVLVEIAAPRRSIGGTGCCGQPVRGTSGQIEVSMGPVAPPEDPSTWSTITWTEHGRELRALFRTTQRDAVVSILDRLVPRDPTNLQAGFDPGSASPAQLIDEADRSGRPRVPVATFVYSPGPPDGAGQVGITVRTSLGSGPEDIDGFGWVRRAMLFPRQADGSIAIAVGSGGGETAYQPDPDRPPPIDAFRTVDVIWPDGRSVFVTGRGQSPTTLHDLAMTAAPQPIGAARSMADEATTRVLATTLVASADLPSGRVELRGQPDHPGALCLRSASGESSCARVADWFGFPFSLLNGSVVLDGQWFVLAAAAQNVQVQTDTSGDPTVSTPPVTPSEIPVETATVGPWHVLLAPMPPDWDRVAVAFGDGSGEGCTQPDSVTCSVRMSQGRPSAW